MKVVSATAIGNLISAHAEGNDEKFYNWANFIADAYEEAGNETAAKLLRNRINSVEPSSCAVLDDLRNFADEDIKSDSSEIVVSEDVCAAQEALSSNCEPECQNWLEISKDIFEEQKRQASSDKIDGDGFFSSRQISEYCFQYYLEVGDRYFTSVQNIHTPTQHMTKDLARWLSQHKNRKPND